MISRKTLIASMGALVAARAASNGSVDAATETSIITQLQWVKDVQNAGWWVADAEGYFRDAGIISTELAGGPSLSSVEAVVAAGEAQIGFDNLERVIEANNQGTDFVIIGALYQRTPLALLSLPAKPVRSARDILGKRIGMQQSIPIIDYTLRANHLPLNYTKVIVGFDPEPLLEGACDAYLCFLPNQPVKLAARHIPFVTASFDELGYETYSDTLFCTREFLNRNRAALVRYVHALQRGWARNSQHPEIGAHLAAATYGAALGLDEAQQLLVNRAQIPLMESDQTRTHGRLWIDVERVRGPIYRSLRYAGFTSLPSVQQLIDTSIVREAYHAH